VTAADPDDVDVDVAVAEADAELLLLDDHGVAVELSGYEHRW